MKIATYHRRIHNDYVRFFKGDIKDLIVELLTESAINKFCAIQDDVNWQLRRNSIANYIRFSRQVDLQDITLDLSENLPSVYIWLKHYVKCYRSGRYDDNVKWDRIYVTTLFTFYWDITVKTIISAKRLLSDDGKLVVGGVMATVAPQQLEADTGIKPIIGLLDKPGMLLDDSIIVDELPLDYSILEETDYKYPESDAYYGYMTRGCVRKCEFCAVPVLEPHYKSFIPIRSAISNVDENCGIKRNLLLLDNNVLASDKFEEIIDEIKLSGFTKDAVFIEPNKLEYAIRNLKLGYNDYAYRRIAHKELLSMFRVLKGEALIKYKDILKSSEIIESILPSKGILIDVYSQVAQTYEKYRKKIPKKRYVDFNQGVDARFIDEHKMQLLSEIPIRPLRIAFDKMKFRKPYEKAVRLAAKYGITHLSNYLLYNYDDEPIELYQRLKLNIDLCEELGISIYSFPMKYNPINDEEGFYQNRDFLGVQWNRKFIRAIQLVLNATKGKVGKGKSFFEEAFGATEKQYTEILYMPEAYILNRMHYKHNGITEEWRKLFQSLTDHQKKIVLPIIESNYMNTLPIKVTDPKLSELLSHYQYPEKHPDNLAAAV
jgi:hypothetical protein